jgi:hypothetical protein
MLIFFLKNFHLNVVDSMYFWGERNEDDSISALFGTSSLTGSGENHRKNLKESHRALKKKEANERENNTKK